MTRDSWTDILPRAVACLKNGDLVAFPTETVYGLGADATQPLAVRRIFAAKGRPVDHPVIVHVADFAEAQRWGRPTAQNAAMWDALAQAFWPGPLTVVVPRAPWVPDEVTGGRDTVGIRVPSHPVAQALLRAFGGGVAAPSANRFGHVSPTEAEHVRSEFGHDVLVVDGGPSSVGVESTIVDLTQARPAILRHGGVPEEAIIPIVGPLGHSTTAAPGTLAAHYAPMAGVLVSHTPDADAEKLRAAGRTVAILRATDPHDHARRLYAELRAADAAGIDILIAEPAAPRGIGKAINDRLLRASVGSPVHAPHKP